MRRPPIYAPLGYNKPEPRSNVEQFNRSTTEGTSGFREFSKFPNKAATNKHAKSTGTVGNRNLERIGKDTEETLTRLS